MATTDMKDSMSAEAFTEANRAYFDDLANKYTEKPWQKKMIVDTHKELRSKLQFIGVDWADKHTGDTGREVRLLDYACGTGSISNAFKPYITSTTGIDISKAMIGKFKENVSATEESGEPPITSKAYIGNLLSSSKPNKSTTDSTVPKELQLDPESPELYDFDIAAIGYGFHHFAEPATAIRRLGRRLKKGGVLLIIDFIAPEDDHEHTHHGHHHGNHHGNHGDHDHPHSHSHQNGHNRLDDDGWTTTAASHTIHKHGFSRQDMQTLFDEAATYDDPSERVQFENFGWSEYEQELEMKVPAKKGSPEAERGEDITVYRRGFLARAQRAD